MSIIPVWARGEGEYKGLINFDTLQLATGRFIKMGKCGVGYLKAEEIGETLSR